MGVYLGGGDGAVPKKPLYVADIHVLLQQKRGKGMPEHMGRDVYVLTAQKGVFVYYLPHGLLGKPPVEPVYKEISREYDIRAECAAVFPEDLQHVCIFYLHYALP